MHSKIHFIGIGGSGMLGLAEWAIIEGLQVTGSDSRRSAATERLEALGARITYHHEGDHVSRADLVVRSTAIRPNNPELLRGMAAGIRTISRGQFLGEMSRHRTSIAICGSHGKSTTTALVAHALRESWPAHIYLGAVARNFGSSFHSGNKDRLIAEVDESDGTFLDFHNDFSILTGLSNDHEAHYGGQSALYDAFEKFLYQSSLLTSPICCAADPEVQNFLEQRNIPCQTYGFDPDCDVYASEITSSGHMSRFVVRAGRKAPQSQATAVELPLLGRHNILNALAPFAIALQLQIPWSQIAEALSKFAGVERRLERLFANENLDVFSDYAHNPQKISAALKTLAESYGTENVLCVFEPHRYTRLQSMWNGFVTALKSSRYQFVLPLYSAGEAPIPGFGSQELVAALNNNHQVHDAPQQEPQASDIEPTDAAFSGILDLAARQHRRHGKVAIIFVGAGYSHDYACQFVALLGAHDEKSRQTT